jgi:negative regulator of flagellin synthesis FlgM
MVQNITSNVTQLRRVGEADAASAGRARPEATGQLDRGRALGSDQVSLSAAAQALPAEMQSGPPINQSLVDRLGQDIAAGRYPLNPEKIAQALVAHFTD